MFRVIVVSLLFVCLLAGPVVADCPRMLNPDDPPCVPCPYVWTAWWWGVATYADGSELDFGGDILRNCEGDHQYPVTHIGPYYCPNGPDDEQCIARQHYFNQ